MSIKKTENRKPIQKLRSIDLIQIIGGCSNSSAGESDGAGVNRKQRTSFKDYNVGNSGDRFQR